VHTCAACGKAAGEQGARLRLCAGCRSVRWARRALSLSLMRTGEGDCRQCLVSWKFTAYTRTYPLPRSLANDLIFRLAGLPSSCFVNNQLTSSQQLCPIRPLGRYCGTECARQHWKTGGHREECALLKHELDEGRAGDEARTGTADSSGGGTPDAYDLASVADVRSGVH
jgi:hypothetical protein